MGALLARIYLSWQGVEGTLEARAGLATELQALILDAVQLLTLFHMAAGRSIICACLLPPSSGTGVQVDDVVNFLGM